MTLADPVRPGDQTAEEDRCARCGTALEPDQEWCLECGSARTFVHRPPDPRIAAAIVGSVLLAGLVALAIVLLNLSTAANRDLPAARTGSAAAKVTASAPRPTPAGGTAANATATLADWPVGLSGWTIVLGRSPVRATAVALARQLAAGGLSTGVLDSSQHPHLQAGYYVVFSGRYPHQLQAAAAAAALQTHGQPQALVREVAPPGGL